MAMSQTNQAQRKTMQAGQGFIAALDQSGGSTPQALAAYGIAPSEWSTEDEMFALVQAMRARIMTSPGFTGARILGTILFERTMEQDVAGLKAADYLWTVKRVVPFLKVDQGLMAEQAGVQLMKPMPGLDALLERAVQRGIFGTKMRSVIRQAHPDGIQAVVRQQFEQAARILEFGLVPIVEPEVDIHCPEKQQAEELLRQEILTRLESLPSGRQVMLKLTLPTIDDFYEVFVKDSRILRVAALSGGYSQAEANTLLRRNHGVIASFSRALAEGLSARQTDAEFDAALTESIQRIYEASIT
jgi:fructose-bisphosphate aldolase class I